MAYIFWLAVFSGLIYGCYQLWMAGPIWLIATLILALVLAIRDRK